MLFPPTRRTSGRPFLHPLVTLAPAQSGHPQGTLISPFLHRQPRGKYLPDTSLFFPFKHLQLSMPTPLPSKPVQIDSWPLMPPGSFMRCRMSFCMDDSLTASLFYLRYIDLTCETPFTPLDRQRKRIGQNGYILGLWKASACSKI